METSTSVPMSLNCTIHAIVRYLGLNGSSWTYVIGSSKVTLQLVVMATLQCQSFSVLVDFVALDPNN